MAGGGIEYGCPSCMTTPIGLTLTGIRSAKSAGAIFNGRNRARSSAIRSASGTPVARDGRTVFVSSSQSRGCCSRSARSRNRRCLKNEPFTQPTRFSTLPFLLRPVRPADLHPESEIERHAGERRIPLSHDAIAAPLQRDGLRPIKYRDQGDAAKAGDVIDERAHQAFDLLIGDQRHFGPARVLQSRGEEMHDLLGAVLIVHADFAKVVLRKLSGGGLRIAPAASRL